MAKVTTIESSKLIELLSEVKPVATKQIAENTIPVVTFDKNQIIANNDISEYKIKFDSGLENCTVNYNKFLDLLKNLPKNKKITLEQKKRKLVIYHKSAINKNKQTTIPTIITKDDYLPISRNDEAFKPIPEDFTKGISKCLPILPKEALKFDLDLLMVDSDKIVSSDDGRACQYILEDEIEADRFFLSKLHIDIFLSGAFERYNVNENVVNFVGESSDVAMSLPYEVNYPDITNAVFDTEDSKVFTVKKKRFSSELDRTIIFSEGTTETIKKAFLEIENKKYSITAKNEDGRNKEYGRTNFKGEMSCFFNPVYLRQGLSTINEKDIDLHFIKYEGAYRIVIEKDNFKFVMATYD